MRWNLFTAFVVAALSVSSANGSTVSQARARNRARTATIPHTSPAHSVQNKVNRPSPEEVGRAAGLKIRRDLAHRHDAQKTPHSQQRVASSQAHPRSGQSSHQAAIAKASSHASEPSAGRKAPTIVEYAAAQPSPRNPEHTANRSRSTIMAISSGPDPSASREQAVVPVRSTNLQHTRLGTEVASLQSSSFAPTPAASVVAPPFAEPNPVAQPVRSSDSRPTDDPAPIAGAEVTSDASTKDSDTAAAGDSGADIPATDGSSADIPVAQTRALTQGAAIRAVSLHTSRFGMPAPLVGSRAILEHQNAMSDAEGLERIEDEDDLADRIAKRLLVPVPTSIALTINGNLPVSHRYCRPWTALFLADLARSHAAEFHRPLEVSSAVRTVAYQKKLMGVNGNAAAAEGDIVSPHLTGATIDIAKKGLNRSELYWMRNRLNSLEADGKIDVEEEFRQSCFHITVYKSYIGAGPAHKPLPQATPLPVDDPDSVMDPADSTAPGV